MRGEHKCIAEQNQRDAQTSLQRDRAANDQLIFNQLAQRRLLQEHSSQTQQRNIEQKQEIKTDLSRYQDMAKTPLETRREEFMRVRRQTTERKPRRSRNRGPSRGP